MGWQPWGVQHQDLPSQKNGESAASPLSRSASLFKSRLCSSRAAANKDCAWLCTRVGPSFPTQDASHSDAGSGAPCRVGPRGQSCTCSWLASLRRAPKASGLQPGIPPHSSSSQALPPKPLELLTPSGVGFSSIQLTQVGTGRVISGHLPL